MCDMVYPVIGQFVLQPNIQSEPHCLFYHEIQRWLMLNGHLPLTNAVFSSNDEEIICIYACLTFISCLCRLGIKGGYHWCCWSGVVLHAADVPCQAIWFHLFLSSYVSVILWETSMLLPYLCWMESFKHFINRTSCPAEVSSSFLSFFLFEVGACILLGKRKTEQPLVTGLFLIKGKQLLIVLLRLALPS